MVVVVDLLGCQLDIATLLLYQGETTLHAFRFSLFLSSAKQNHIGLCLNYGNVISSGVSSVVWGQHSPQDFSNVDEVTFYILTSIAM
mmetsp:Transcript_29845/g.63307  ORF Transcript_29845/g.63307 Transcript_29845/m.63307 type:complete len:87 (-) Transcript_29845:3102-3362(-)